MSRLFGLEVPFDDRRHAGRRLAEACLERGWRADCVVALPRGGLLVGAEVARALGARLRVALARKLHHPYQPEFAAGALDPAGRLLWNPDLVPPGGAALELERIPAFARQIEAERRAQATALERYGRWCVEPAEVGERRLLLVDDGLVTGLTLQAAVLWLAAFEPAWLGVAVPVAEGQAARRLARLLPEGDEALLALEPLSPLGALGASYRRFEPVPDEEALSLLEETEGG
ncbi:MAG: phosphoribosyltransferase family protein [Bacillota bacterium]|nr:phosphoribosyltransferase family protein [Bacillota bacterium]